MVAELPNGVRLAYDDEGQGEPALVCIHGWCGAREEFRPFVELARRHYRVVNIDLRGHGESPGQPADFGNHELMKDTDALLSMLEIGSFVPITLSHAGWIAHHLAKTREDDAKGVVLVNWLVFEMPGAFGQALEEMQEPGAWKVARAKLSTRLSKAPAEVAARQWTLKEQYGEAMYARAAREILAAFQQHRSPLDAFAALQSHREVLLVHGPLGSAQQEGLLRRFALDHFWFRSILVTEGPDVPTFDAPAEMLRIVQDFIARLPRH